jgi:hypothetical protein
VTELDQVSEQYQPVASRESGQQPVQRRALAQHIAPGASGQVQV